MPGVKIDEANVPTKAIPPIVYVWYHFLARDQLCGFRGSFASSHSRALGRSGTFVDVVSCGGFGGVAFSGSASPRCSAALCPWVLSDEGVVVGEPFPESAKLGGLVPAAVVADHRFDSGTLDWAMLLCGDVEKNQTVKGGRYLRPMVSTDKPVHIFC
jgi:hypothetical protein